MVGLVVHPRGVDSVVQSRRVSKEVLVMQTLTEKRRVVGLETGRGMELDLSEFGDWLDVATSSPEEQKVVVLVDVPRE